VGTKVDLLDDPSSWKEGSKPVSIEQGEHLAADIKALKYIECSALTQKNVKEVFDFAIKCVLVPKLGTSTKTEGGCTIF